MDYHLKPVGKTCESTGEDLPPGSNCYSVVVERNGELVRLDFSEDAWTGPPEGSIGHWQCTIPEPTQNKVQPLDTEALMRYFEQLCEDANPAEEKFRYILALLLLQKRRLKIDGSRQDGEIEYLQLIGSQSEGPFEVRDQQLSDDEVSELQNNLNQHLASEWS